jgi:TonB family protein
MLEESPMLKHFKGTVFGMLVIGVAAAVPSNLRAQETEPLRKVTKKVAAAYPPLAVQGRLTGTVKLVALVTPEGNVKSVRTLGGNPVLVAAAEDAVKQWKFEVTKKESSEPVALKFVGPGQQQ